jgi:plastocyanin
MSILGRKVSPALVAGLAASMVLAALIPALSGTSTREITLVARGMAFYADGDYTTPNPTLRVRAGERVRVVLRNEERGITHDFAVPVVGAAVDLLKWNETGDVVLRAPDRPGTYEYLCQPHRLMMRGLLIVE